MSNLFKRKQPKEQETSFKELSFSKKVEYIWEYYKIYIISFIIIVGVIISFVNAYRRNDYESECYIAIIDGKMTGSDSETDAITKGFTEYLGIDGKKKRVECDYNYSLIQRDFDQEAAVSQAKLYTLASTNNLDGFLANIDYIDYYSTDKETFLTDLNEILSPDELKKLDSYIVYYTKESGEKIPIALDLTDTKIKKDTDFTMEHPCYGVVVTAPHFDNAVKFIRYAFDL